ncbi:hypothetical protein [uncultured Lactobacillus sp.]|uniref:hypothetical protein n=1 Tax=uncultured Lactobacillus sp. TaxID=153152 RepID=UPI0026665FF6|nr:hypothetical protein [uncultured Lactobacillus sp.]
MSEKRSDYRRRQAQEKSPWLDDQEEAAGSAASSAHGLGKSRQNQLKTSLSSEDKAQRLKKRLNFAILIVCLLIVAVLLILFKL